MVNNAPFENRYYPPSVEVFTQTQKDINRHTALKETVGLASVIVDLELSREVAIQAGFTSDEHTYLDLIARAASLNQELLEARYFHNPKSFVNPRRI